jgi:diacylglycerol kinase family enzyme
LTEVRSKVPSSEQRDVVLVVNRRARHLVRWGPLLAVLARPRRGVRLVETETLDALDVLASDLADRSGAPALVFAGGDGSYMAGVSAIARAFAARGREMPKVAFAPGGTVSTIAKNWGMRGDPVRYAERLLDGIALGRLEAIRRPTLRVRANDGERIGFIVGSGLVARFFEAYEDHGAGGYGDAARIVAKVFAGSFVGSRFARSILDPMPCTLELDGARAPFDRVSLVCASVVRDLGLGMRLLYRAGEALDRFHAVATPLAPSVLGPQMPMVLAGRPLLGPRLDGLARSLVLRFPGEDGSYVLDGELFRAHTVEVRAGPPIDLFALRDV